MNDLPYVVNSRIGTLAIVLGAFPDGYEATRYAIYRRQTDDDKHVTVTDSDGNRVWPSPSRGITL